MAEQKAKYVYCYFKKYFINTLGFFLFVYICTVAKINSYSHPTHSFSLFVVLHLGVYFFKYYIDFLIECLTQFSIFL